MSAPPRSPVTADQLRPGDPYELSEGRLVECLPTGRRGGRSNLVGGEVLDTDPAVEAAGVDVGVSPRPEMLRAPDIAVGNIPDEPGWATEAPPLAVEYADTGQDEVELQLKIEELLAAGTRWVWVVRLDGMRRVEVHEAAPAPSASLRPSPAQGAPTAAHLHAPAARAAARGRPAQRRPARVAVAGETLEAPGVLRNAVPIEALYDRSAAHEAALRNLLQRKGYDGLDAVLDEGRKQGRATGLRAAVRDVCELLGIELSPEREAALEAMDEAALGALREQLKRDRRWP
ncbi:Uma2 family endonuclease [Sorangium sp. So ce1078]|uniref:Uma2 family endonuclease n=1 Tax=Sorangium sp. So ce1078 TaxID=3133329 RepID=UPI003F60AFAF